MEQFSHALSYREAKDQHPQPIHFKNLIESTIVKDTSSLTCTNWTLYTRECSCGNRIQTSGHILQNCPAYTNMQRQIWLDKCRQEAEVIVLPFFFNQWTMKNPWACPNNKLKCRRIIRNRFLL
uniref:Uncharacterized protein n=1 Tax=Arion vulgaris TaxID=1028688 RepID=A0A0B6ZAI5_9EUPU